MTRAALALATLMIPGVFAGCVPGTYVATTTTYPAPAPDPYSEVYVNTSPPPAVVEYRSYPPGPGYVWVDGYWDWSGYDWYWTRGYWAAGRPNYYYVRPSYVVVDGRNVYRRGYWYGQDGRRDYTYGRPVNQGPSGGWRGGNGAPAT